MQDKERDAEGTRNTRGKRRSCSPSTWRREEKKTRMKKVMKLP
jgi:hypothetical protein